MYRERLMLAAVCLSVRPSSLLQGIHFEAIEDLFLDTDGRGTPAGR
jgi:hypothetical protein